MIVECSIQFQVGRVEGGAALGLWLELGLNELLVVSRQDGVDAVGVGR